MSVTTGPRLGTVTAKACRASSPVGSRAVTAIVAAPLANAVIRTESPATSTVTATVSEDTAAKLSESSSGSEK